MGKRAEKEVEQIVAEMRVKKYVFNPSGRIRWIVVGKTRDYIVLPTVPYCSCDDYFFRVLHKGKRSCYHIDAVRLAMEKGRYEEIEESDEWYGKLMDEWMNWEGGERER